MAEGRGVQGTPAWSGRGVLGAAEGARRMLLGLSRCTKWSLHAQAHKTT